MPERLSKTKINDHISWYPKSNETIYKSERLTLTIYLQKFIPEHIIKDQKS